MRRLMAFLAGALCVFATSAEAATPAGGSPWQIANGDLVFGAGGVSGRFLYFQEWDSNNDSTSDRDWLIDTLLEHDGEIWWAETDPALADEPGVAASWVQLSGASGSGATITAGTVDPTGGANGDAYFQIDASSRRAIDLAQRLRHMGRIHLAGRWQRGRFALRRLTGERRSGG